MFDLIVGGIFLTAAIILLFWAITSGQLRSTVATGGGSKFTPKGIIGIVTKPITGTWKWSGKYMITRWIVVFAAVVTGYSYFQESQTENVYKVVPVTQSDGSMLLRFEFPEGIERKRIEFLETFVVQVPKEELAKLDKMPLIGFKFNGTLYEYNVTGEATMRDGLSKITGIDISEGRSTTDYVGQKATRKGMTGIVERSELEWESGSPYTIQIVTKPRGIPLSVQSRKPIHYKVLVEKSEPEEDKK